MYLDIADSYGALHVEAFYGPVVLTKVQETVFGLNSVNNRIAFSWVGRQSILDTERAARLQSSMMAHLLSAIS